jgi:hypothetical protein
MRHFKKSRNKPIAFLGAAALGAAVLAAPRPANAAVDPATVTTVIKIVSGIIDVVKKLDSLLNPPASSGPTLKDLSIQLAGVQTTIVNEMRTSRNRVLQSRTTTVFNVYRDLSDNRVNDPTNDDLWSTLRFEQQSIADQMDDIIRNQNDGQSAYELAAPFNVLIATGIAVMDLKAEIFPGFSASWRDTHEWLQKGMHVNYHMIGAQKHECEPGFNPGFSASRANVAGRYHESQLWKRLNNRWFTTMTFFCGATQCNAATKACITSTSCTTGGGAGIPPTYACGPGNVGAECAISLAKPKFDNDAQVKLVRGGMTAIQRLSGGTDYNVDSNDPLVAQGQMVDPWVPAPSCPGHPIAYPHVP